MEPRPHVDAQRERTVDVEQEDPVQIHASTRNVRVALAPGRVNARAPAAAAQRRTREERERAEANRRPRVTAHREPGGSDVDGSSHHAREERPLGERSTVSDLEGRAVERRALPLVVQDAHAVASVARLDDEVTTGRVGASLPSDALDDVQSRGRSRAVDVLRHEQLAPGRVGGLTRRLGQVVRCLALGQSVRSGVTRLDRLPVRLVATSLSRSSASIRPVSRALRATGSRVGRRETRVGVVDGRLERVHAHRRRRHTIPGLLVDAATTRPPARADDRGVTERRGLHRQAGAHLPSATVDGLGADVEEQVLRTRVPAARRAAGPARHVVMLEDVRGAVRLVHRAKTVEVRGVTHVVPVVRRAAAVGIRVTQRDALLERDRAARAEVDESAARIAVGLVDALGLLDDVVDAVAVGVGHRHGADPRVGIADHARHDHRGEEARQNHALQGVHPCSFPAGAESSLIAHGGETVQFDLHIQFHIPFAQCYRSTVMLVMVGPT